MFPSYLTRIIQSLYYALLYPAIVPIEGAVLFELHLIMNCMLVNIDHHDVGVYLENCIYQITVSIG
jgi:hypothetical protein